jgi:hypothetical protein
MCASTFSTAFVDQRPDHGSGLEPGATFIAPAVSASTS